LRFGSKPALTQRSTQLVARVLAAALRQVRSLARVAELSRRAHLQSRELNEQLRERAPHTVIARSEASRRIFEEVIPAVAKHATTVLVVGETGTGKEVVARRIHQLSSRALRPFVGINCGAIPAGLVESALFGHERGAFTSAQTMHRGVFERANGGTLLLDEVGELSLDGQVRLLRVLETGELSRVGGERSIKVDVRVIAATHRDLSAMVESGTFRRDLYYRLDVFRIEVPPLRERRADIEPLARHIALSLAAKHGHAVPRIDRTTMSRLRAYDWPGNVRELENVIERSLILSEDGFSLDLPPPQSRARAPLSFEEGSRRCIVEALGACDGRVYGSGGAAAMLKLKPTTLMSKMKKLRIKAKRSQSW